MRRTIRRSLLVIAAPMLGLFATGAVAAQDGTLRVATFGTSLTAGGGWQAPLAEAIEACTRGKTEVSNDAKAGAASDWGVEAVEAIAAEQPDLVFLEFAANDAALNKGISISTSTRNLRTIIEAFRRKNPDVVIYIMTMNPISGRRHWVRPWQDRYEEAHRQLSQELRLHHIDHRPEWQAMGSDRLYLAIPDGVHPTVGPASAVIVPNIMKRLQDDGILQCAEGPTG